MYLTNGDSKSEQRTKIEIKLFVTNLCPQCIIATKRIDSIVENSDEIDLEIIDVTKDSIGSQQYEKLTDTPYFLIQEKYVVPGTSSENYIREVLSTVGASV